MTSVALLQLVLKMRGAPPRRGGAVFAHQCNTRLRLASLMQGAPETRQGAKAQRVVSFTKLLLCAKFNRNLRVFRSKKSSGCNLSKQYAVFN